MAQARISKEVRVRTRRFIDLLRRDKFPIQKVIVFGSHAKGVAGRGSDIDICVISSKFGHKKGSIDPWDYLWKKRFELKDYELEPLGFNPRDFIDEDPLVWEIKKTGKIVYSRRKNSANYQ